MTKAEDGVDDAPNLDSGMFEMVFGSEKFEPLVGELALTSMFADVQKQQQMGQEGGDGRSEEENALAKFKQSKRCVQCEFGHILDKYFLYFENGDDPHK